jgi:hypothetical protein
MVKPHRMYRALLAAMFLAAGSLQASIWPPQLGAAKLGSTKPVTVQDQKLWSEYGLQEAEQAEYTSDAGKFKATAYRLQDSTAALGAYDWQRPKDAKQSQLGPLAADTPEETIVAQGNYLFVFQGYKPQATDLAALIQTLPKFEQSPLPTLRDFLPVEGRIPNSERYVIGPAGLEDFAPAIPASAAAFHLGSEAQVASFHAPGGEIKLAIFNYPTPNIARERLAVMQQAPKVIAKRSGPLVAVVLDPPNANDAEWLLSLVKYQATISWDQYVPSRRDNIGDLIVNAFILIGILLAFATLAGLIFGGFRAYRRRGGQPDPDALTALHLSDQ